MAQNSAERWRAHLDAASKAGVTLAQYAREHGLSPHALYAARQAMRKHHEKGPQKKGNKSTKAFVPVRLSAPVTTTTLSVRMPNGLELCFGNVETGALQSLLPLLAGLPCSA